MDQPLFHHVTEWEFSLSRLGVIIAVNNILEARVAGTVGLFYWWLDAFRHCHPAERVLVAVLLRDRAETIERDLVSRGLPIPFHTNPARLDVQLPTDIEIELWVDAFATLHSELWRGSADPSLDVEMHDASSSQE